MNFLAHLWLADQTGTSLAGSILGDIVRGRDLSAYPDDIALGIRLHRRVDAATDRHPLIVAVRQDFAAGERRYAGIVLDLVCDHLLARQWPDLHGEVLAAFSQRAAQAQQEAGAWYRQAGAREPEAARFARLLASYQSVEGMDRAMGSVQSRLRRGEDFAAAARHWQQHAQTLQHALPQLLRALRQTMVEAQNTMASAASDSGRA